MYDEEYAKKYAALATTPLGRAIYAARWALILKYVQGGRLLDYGSGPGSFNAHGPDSFDRVNYDVNPSCGFTDRLWEGGAGAPFDVLTMWDSIEHVPAFYNEIRDINAPWLFISTPNLEAFTDAVVLEKHYRPREHIYYFDRHSLGVILEDLGYRIKEINFDEGKLRDPMKPTKIITVVACKQ